MARTKSKHNVPGNGFERAILRVQSKILIDEWAWFAVIDEQNSREPAPKPDHPSLLTVRQFCKKHHAWTEPAVRNIIFHARRAA